MRALVLWLALALSACAEAGNEEFRKSLEKRLNKTFPEVKVTAVEKAPMKGMLEVELNGRDQVYVTRDGRYMFTGTTFELTSKGAQNLRQKRFRRIRRQGLGRIDPSKAITFAAERPEAEVYVFTDVSCGYCRKLHRSIDAINERGITVHYLAYPRAGMDSRAAKLMQQVWCADNRKAALTQAKATGDLSQSSTECADPVAEQHEMGRRFGVRGTPSIYTPEGRKIGGYLPPAELARALGVADAKGRSSAN